MMGPFFVTVAGVSLHGERIPAGVRSLHLRKGVRDFRTAEQAEKSARRSGVGARVWWWDLEGEAVVVADIARKSEHRTGLVTEVTVAGGRYL